jgi:arsenical pump membrane protein
MLLPWVCAVVITIAVVGLWRWRSLRDGVVVRSRAESPLRFGIGALAVLLSVAAMLALRDPALPVLVIGVVAAANEVLVRRKMRVREVLVVASPYLLGPLFALAVLVGWLGRSWHRVGHLVAHTSSLATSLVGAGTSLLINNLPAASLFSGQSIAHPYALLLGLNLGPNIFVTGSLSSMLWFRLARSEGARPSLRTFVTIGPPVALLTIFVGSLFV